MLFYIGQRMFIPGLFFISSIFISSCTLTSRKASSDIPNDFTLSRTDYEEQIYGFWLGQCIANWTGLVTEMDKIGNIGEIKTGAFYTRKDWGTPDQPSIWGQGIPSNLSTNIDFVFRDSTTVWGADDDTDIEYMYQYLMTRNQTVLLTPEQIREGWLTHIKPEEENYLWVSNQRAFDLMKQGILPPATGNPDNNEHFDMIDAQLTTEIFGLFAPGRPDVALKMAELPITTSASGNAAGIARFYVTMYALASSPGEHQDRAAQLRWMAQTARTVLPDTGYAAKMFDYTFALYQSGIPWEQTRDSLYEKYQVKQEDGYSITSRNLYCNGCFAAGINFAASLVSLFYGEGDLLETIKIGSLAGWDSDNPTATWGGLIGFMIGRKGVEEAFQRTFSDRFDIHRTRQNFPGNGIDTFENMAKDGIRITNLAVLTLMEGRLDTLTNSWIIPRKDLKAIQTKL